MSELTIDIKTIGKVYGDRVLVRRLGEPEKKSGLFVPLAYARGKKEPKKAWFAQLIGIGSESIANSEYKLQIGKWIGIEPLGNHYAGFKGEDGSDYVWVPDEHICLADAGTIGDYYADKHDKKSEPRLRVIGKRLIVRSAPEKESKIARPDSNKEHEAMVSDVIAVGDVKDDRINLGTRLVHVADDSGASCRLDIFEPHLTVLRHEDIIATIEMEKVNAEYNH